MNILVTAIPLRIKILYLQSHTNFIVLILQCECVGHVQKRLGTRLQNKVKEYKGSKTPLGGRNKLTKKTIDSMQNWYGLTIRQNSDLYTMKNAIGAILCHCTDFTDKDNNYHVNKINLPEYIHKIIEPIFVNLSDDVLLNKCLHGKTQNPNEALNKIIWTKCPQTVFVHKTVIDMGGQFSCASIQ